MTSIFHHPSLGAIRGVLSASSTILQLHNLPYARIPQRFAHSVPVNELPNSATLSEGYDGTRLPPASIQIEGAPESDTKTFQGPLDILDGYHEEQAEDCLRLSISMPKDATPSSKLPVLVFIHGGAYFIGSGSRPYYSPLTLLNQATDSRSPLIFVSLQYRLGVLGFMHSTSAGDLIPANNGLYDQLLAFRWLERYVAGFGGDPTRISVIGQSAGGESISLHNTAGYDNTWTKSIAFSGSLVTMPGNTPEEHERNFRDQAEKLGIKNAQSKPGDQIAREMIQADVDKIRELAWVGQPCSQSEILPYEKPSMAIARTRPPHSKTLQSQIISTTTYDGGISYNMMIGDDSRKNHAATFNKIARDLLSHSEDLLAVYDMRLSDDDPTALRKICQFESDIGFFAGALSMVQSSSSWTGKTYFLIFDLGIPFPGNLPPKQYATHTWDIVSLLGAYEDRLDADYKEVITDFRAKILDYVTRDEEPWPAWMEDEGHALIVQREGVRVIRKDEYMGPETRIGKLLALADKEKGKDGADLLWDGVCRRFLMKGE